MNSKNFKLVLSCILLFIFMSCKSSDEEESLNEKEKAKADSIAAIEKAKADSIAMAEKSKSKKKKKKSKLNSNDSDKITNKLEKKKQDENTDDYSSWERLNMLTGEVPECENITPLFDYSISNYLRIVVGPGADAIVKLMDRKSNKCIRCVYVQKNEQYEMQNIPQGYYYVKIALGEDYRKKVENNICYMKFVKFAHYKKGTQILDYHIRKEIIDNLYEKTSIPSYEIYLDIISSNRANTFISSEISEQEFNK